MIGRSSTAAVFIAFALLATAAAGQAIAGPLDARLVPRFLKLTRDTTWAPVTAIKIPFRTFHPQGMVKIGENFYVSSVEIRAAPKRLAAPFAGYDRDSGAGVGHLFRIGPDGRLLADLVIGEGSIYHPGGIDFDGASIWVPVSEYRPHSRAIVYKVDPGTMKATEVFRFKDHIGGVVYDAPHLRLHGISWGSREFYTWTLDAAGGLLDTTTGAEALRATNPEHDIDYQDCHSAGEQLALCAGVGESPSVHPGPGGQLGGVDLVDLRDHRPVWRLPIELRSPSGRSMTQNPFFLEATKAGLRAYFMPDDDASTLFVFDAAVR